MQLGVGRSNPVAELAATDESLVSEVPSDNLKQSWEISDQARYNPPPCRSELARENPERATINLTHRLIVDDLREQARSYRRICRQQKCAPWGAFFCSVNNHPQAFASQARSPCSSLMRVGKPITSSALRNGSAGSSSTLAMCFTSHSPRATSSAAATGGTPAV